MGKKALITEITGQDGSFLADLLINKGYEVHGIVRRVALEDPGHRLWRIRHIRDKIALHAASLESYASLFNVINQIQPDECYHLAAQSFVSYSFEDEFSTINTNINGTHYVLSALKLVAPNCRFYFAGSSEMFGKVLEVPQNEKTPFYPRSPYGISKVAGFDLTRNYREAYNLFACNGILFNHRIQEARFRIRIPQNQFYGCQNQSGLGERTVPGKFRGETESGYSPDYVEAMWLMLQQPGPDDYVIATGETHSVREFAAMAFDMLDLRWEDYVVVDENLFRPAEVHELRGNSSKARSASGWAPKVNFEKLVQIMVEADCEKAAIE